MGYPENVGRDSVIAEMHSRNWAKAEELATMLLGKGNDGAFALFFLALAAYHQSDTPDKHRLADLLTNLFDYVEVQEPTNENHQWSVLGQLLFALVQFPTTLPQIWKVTNKLWNDITDGAPVSRHAATVHEYLHTLYMSL